MQVSSKNVLESLTQLTDPVEIMNGKHHTMENWTNITDISMRYTSTSIRVHPLGTFKNPQTLCIGIKTKEKESTVLRMHPLDIMNI